MNNKRTTTIYPSSAKELEELGQRLKDARLRRRFSMETVCARADISRPTLYKVENGEPSVAIGIYVQVLRVLLQRPRQDVGEPLARVPDRVRGLRVIELVPLRHRSS